MQAAGGAPLRPVGSSVSARRSALATTVLVGAAANVLLLDVATKTLVVDGLAGRSTDVLGGLVTIREARNAGAAFGIAGGATVLFTLVALAVVVVILRNARRTRSLRWALTLGLVLGGAAGNLVDRLARAPGPLRGHVVDFIDVGVWPVFNIADTAITIGAGLALLLSFRGVDFAADAPPALRSGRDTET